jgi:hypothetical protein
MTKLKRNTNILLLFSVFIITVLFFIACDDTPNGPEEPPPGSRDYTWEVDTLHVPFSFFTSISGTSENDVWICGPGDSEHRFYHFNGDEWKAVSLTAPYAPKSISSYKENNVWSGGREGDIYNYNGTNWSKRYQHIIEDARTVVFESIKIFNPTNIIAAGQYFLEGENNYRGVLMEYDGNEWNELRMDSVKTTLADIEMSTDKRVFVLGSSYEQYSIDRYQFYEFKDRKLNLFHAGTKSEEEKGSLLQLGEETYFIIGPDFYSYDDEKFEKIGNLSDDPKFLNVGFGRNVNDIYLGMRDGVAHYNGENTEYVYQSEINIFARKGIVFDNHVFFVGSDPFGNTFIIRGIQNN